MLMWLACCVQLKVYDGVLEGKLQLLLREGLCITVNSDDPAYFGGYCNANYVYLAESLQLGALDIYELHRNSFKASFLSAEEKASFLDMLEERAHAHVLKLSR